jgi:hypothetical protein
LPEEAGGDDAAVVGDEDVAGLEVVEQVGEVAVGDTAVGPIQYQ